MQVCMCKRTVSGIVPMTSDLGSVCVYPCRLELQVCTTVDKVFYLGSKEQTPVQAKHFSNAVNWSSWLFYACHGIPDSSYPLTLASYCWDNRHASVFYSCSYGFK